MTLGDAASTSRTARAPIDRIGATVLKELVETIVTGRVKPGDLLPPEATLSLEFGVSRTVVRESVKRLQEKGMVTVAQGRGTHVNPMTSWNLLDPLVLRSLIGHDDALGVLDDLSVVRASLEAAMAAAVASSHTEEGVAQLAESLDAMRASINDGPVFLEADVHFHELVMLLSGNILAENIAHGLFERARESVRYEGINPERAFELTVLEHERVFDAIVAGDRIAARTAMDEHILGSWERRRLPR